MTTEYRQGWDELTSPNHYIRTYDDFRPEQLFAESLESGNGSSVRRLLDMEWTEDFGWLHGVTGYSESEGAADYRNMLGPTLGDWLAGRHRFYWQGWNSRHESTETGRTVYTGRIRFWRPVATMLGREPGRTVHCTGPIGGGQ